MSKRIRYGFNDIIVDENIELHKYITILDTKGKNVGEVECYYIEEEE